MRPELKKRLRDFACSPYSSTGVLKNHWVRYFLNYDYHWARGKLSHDPIFPALLEQKIFPDHARIVDLGCGRGLLAAWFLAAEQLAANDDWEQTPPVGLRFRGVELMEREATCGNKALQPYYGERVQLSGGDMLEADLSDADVIAILDVLHYVPYEEQDKLLDRIRSNLQQGGIFVTRVGNAGGGLRFAASRLVDTCMTFIQGHRLAKMWCRPLEQWVSLLEARGFSVEATPMSEGTPFANYLLVARVK